MVYTRKELKELGAVFFGDLNDYAYYNGVRYYHENDDYQEGAGNHADFQLFATLPLVASPGVKTMTQVQKLAFIAYFKGSFKYSTTFLADWVRHCDGEDIPSVWAYIAQLKLRGF